MKYQFETIEEIIRCRLCPCLNYEGMNFYCGVTGRETTYYQRNDHKPEWCPLKKVEEDV